jgi:hypothetical protein
VNGTYEPVELIDHMRQLATRITRAVTANS